VQKILIIFFSLFMKERPQTHIDYFHLGLSNVYRVMIISILVLYLFLPFEEVNTQ